MFAKALAGIKAATDVGAQVARGAGNTALQTGATINYLSKHQAALTILGLPALAIYAHNTTGQTTPHGPAANAPMPYSPAAQNRDDMGATGDLVFALRKLS